MVQWRESKAGDFPRKLAGLVKEVEAEVANIVKRFEEGERQAEIERQRREEERRAQAREEAERRRLKSINNSREELSEIIKSWAKIKKIEDFFIDVERRAAKPTLSGAMQMGNIYHGAFNNKVVSVLEATSLRSSAERKILLSNIRRKND